MSALDTLYEIVGSRFPIVSQIIACLVGGIVFGFAWYSIGRHSRSEQARNANSPTVTASSVPTPTESPTASPSPSPTPSAKPFQKRTTAAERERQRILRDLNYNKRERPE